MSLIAAPWVRTASSSACGMSPVLPRWSAAASPVARSWGNALISVSRLRSDLGAMHAGAEQTTVTIKNNTKIH